MSGFGFIAEIVTPTGGYRHLISPYRAMDKPSAACSRGGAAQWSIRQWDYESGDWAADERPICQACITRWRDFIDWSTRHALARLDDLDPAT